MPARKKQGAWILPADPNKLYPNGAGFRFIVCGEGGAKEPSETFPTKAKALAARQERQAVIDGTSDFSVTMALDAYEKYQREEGNKKSSLYQTRRKIETLFTDGDEALEALTEKRCKEHYESLRSRPQPRRRERCLKAGLSQDHAIGAVETGPDGTELVCKCKPFSVDWHRNALSESKTWLRWCADEKFYPRKLLDAAGRTPLDLVKGRGKRNAGKAQLTIDESRLYMIAGHERAAAGDEGALAALMALEMGLRDNEIRNRVARHIDDNGTRLILVDGKTKESDKTIPIPETLQPYFVPLKRGKLPGASMWSGHRGKDHVKGWVQDQVERICRLAGVPVVTAHGMRGTFATLSKVGGLEQLQEDVRRKLRHLKYATSGRHYVTQEAAAEAAQSAVLSVLKGGGR